MGSFLSVIPVVARRVSANARLLAAVVVGTILAAALMSTTAIYTDAIRDLGLTFAMVDRGPEKTNISIRSSSQPTVHEQYLTAQELIEKGTKSLLGGLTTGPVVATARSETFYPTRPGERVSGAEDRPRAHFLFVTDLQDEIKVTEGKLPGDAAFASGKPLNIEVALGGATARRLDIHAGERFDLYPFRDVNREPIHVTIAAIIDPKDSKDIFWFAMPDLFDFPDQGWETLPLLVSEKTYFEGIGAYIPAMSTDFNRSVYVKTAAFNARNADAILARVEAYVRQMSQSIERTSVTTDLPDVLRTFDEKLFFTRIPLLVLVIQIAAIALYYLYMVSTMLVERQSAEIALLKSRGATTAQVMQIYVIEGLAIMVIGLAVGPPLAAVVIGFLGHTPPFHDLSGGTNLHVRLSLDAYAWAVSGAVLAFIMLLVPAFQATRRTMVQQRTASARPPKQAFFTRYYLDLVLVGIGAILFYQLDRSGTLVTENLAGRRTVDPVTLLTPAFFILTVGIFFLRLFPIILRVLAWFVARAQGTSILIGMWQLVRNPVHYSRLVLLLMLATAVGMFTASFGATLDKSFADRAAYETGSGLKLAELQRATTSAGPYTLLDDLQKQLETKGATPLLRTTGSEGTSTTRFGFDILGIDPDSFAEVAYFRKDFADKPLDDLLAALKGGPAPPEEIKIPEGTRWLGAWVNPLDLKGRSGIDFKVRDATGRYFVYNLGPDYFGPATFGPPGFTQALAQPEMQTGWNFLVADMKRPVQSAGGFGFGFFGFTPTSSVTFAPAPPKEPLTIVSFSVRYLDLASRASIQSGSFLIDDLLATKQETLSDNLGTVRLLSDPERKATPFSDPQVVTDFSADKWEPVQGILPVKLSDELSQVRFGVDQVAQLQWRTILGSPQAMPTTHGMRLKRGTEAVPVLASQGYIDQRKLGLRSKITLGIAGNYFEAEIVGIYKLFPTLPDPRTSASLIIDVNQLLAVLNNNPRGPLAYYDEVWLKDGSGDAAKAAQKLVDETKLGGTIRSFKELRTAQQEDPLVAAGWEGILFISFAAILILSAIGFLIYSYLTAQRRTLEFAVLRTMGFSKGQIATVVGFEQLFIISLGMIAGTLMGLRLGSLMIRYMGLTETGDEVLPPMALDVSWFTVGSAWMVLGLVFLVTIGVVVLMYSRLALHRVLRIGEA